jgi:hypothetical protein
MQNRKDNRTAPKMLRVLPCTDTVGRRQLLAGGMNRAWTRVTEGTVGPLAKQPVEDLRVQVIKRMVLGWSHAGRWSWSMWTVYSTPPDLTRRAIGDTGSSPLAWLTGCG